MNTTDKPAIKKKASKSMTKKSLRELYGNIAPNTLTSWLHKHPVLKEKIIDNPVRDYKKIRVLFPCEIDLIFEHLGEP